ncbi:hypothetical protein M0813_07921 [Anaeramoeba flamelloides]|uniref:FHA domain-containing protein n=1 Tax=Anaeramoeba flamelloides TaxID=1746091 RepID=A0ABQ8X9D7_9EUKA|nr:hypothetical protein M0813_07921 [Anaeramoeba flamelloides]
MTTQFSDYEEKNEILLSKNEHVLYLLFPQGTETKMLCDSESISQDTETDCILLDLKKLTDGAKIGRSKKARYFDYSSSRRLSVEIESQKATVCTMAMFCPRTVSRNHIKMFKQEKSFYVNNLSSHGSVCICRENNDLMKMVVPGETFEIKHNDTFWIGTSTSCFAKTAATCFKIGIEMFPDMFETQLEETQNLSLLDSLNNKKENDKELIIEETDEINKNQNKKKEKTGIEQIGKTSSVLDILIDDESKRSQKSEKIFITSNLNSQNSTLNTKIMTKTEITPSLTNEGVDELLNRALGKSNLDEKN